MLGENRVVTREVVVAGAGGDGEGEGLEPCGATFGVRGQDMSSGRGLNLSWRSMILLAACGHSQKPL